MESALQPPPPVSTAALKARLASTIVEQGPRLRAFVRRQLNDLADVEDVVQDVFTELTVAAELMQPIEHLAAWLRRVARNRIIDRYRARGREAPLLDAPADSGDEADESSPRLIDSLPALTQQGPESEHLRSLLIDELVAALDELPPEQREVFVAHEIDGTSFRDLASRSGVKLNTLLGRKHAAVLHLRRRLEEFRTLLES